MNEVTRVGNFNIIKLLGRGGQGQVFLGQHRSEGTLKVAIKKLLVDDRTFDSELLLREARQMVSLNHPHIIRITDVSTDEDPNHPYIVMEYLPQGSLRNIFDTGEELDPLKIANVALRICDALAHAHEKGKFHRDIKPENILLDEWNPKISDWGLVKDIGDGTIVGDGGFAGTPLYSSPEQIRGESSQIDGRTDIYALGIVLYEWFTGSPPLIDEGLSGLFEWHENRRPVPELMESPSIPEQLRVVINKAIKHDVSDRYQSVNEMTGDIEAFVSDLNIDSDSSRKQRDTATVNSNLRSVINEIKKATRVRTIQVLMTAISITLTSIFFISQFGSDSSQPEQTKRDVQPSGLISKDSGATKTSGLAKGGAQVLPTSVSIPNMNFPSLNLGEIATPEPGTSAGLSNIYTKDVQITVTPGKSALLTGPNNQIIVQVPVNSQPENYNLVLRVLPPDRVPSLPERYVKILNIFNISAVSDHIIGQQNFSFEQSARLNVGFNETEDLFILHPNPRLLYYTSNEWVELDIYQYENEPIIFADIKQIGLFAVTIRK